MLRTKREKKMRVAVWVTGLLVVVSGREREEPQSERRKQAVARLKWMRANQAEHLRLSTREETAEEVAANAARSARASRFRLPRGVPAGRVEFSEGEFKSAGRQLFYERRHKLVLCAVPKVACTELIKLVYRLSGDPRWRRDPHFRGDSPIFRKLSLAEANEMMNDDSWTKVIFLRDPLSRLASAYLDKFVQSPKRGIHANYGIRLFGESLSFEAFARRVASNNTDRASHDGLHLGTNLHWKPQRYICSFEKFAHLYHFVGRYENIREHAESLLRALGLWDDFGASGWAPPLGKNHTPPASRVPRDSIFARSSSHKTGSASKYADLYAPPGLEAAVRAAYSMDYDLFDAIGAHPADPPTSGRAWARRRADPRHRRLCHLDSRAFGADYCGA
uniref:Carbohydrate sulfotransferase n=1 Tax=Chrysocystis fragilis TaxID=1411660 RepID=A0A7S0TAN7_9STRA|mmetsp:Transcript_319/g.964  ORF Transcript_319/g.964 Transcript_319/m.964 type:complete len:391 (+) Transcript_319:194-1366(+)